MASVFVRTKTISCLTALLVGIGLTGVNRPAAAQGTAQQQQDAAKRKEQNKAVRQQNRDDRAKGGQGQQNATTPKVGTQSRVRPRTQADQQGAGQQAVRKKASQTSQGNQNQQNQQGKVRRAVPAKGQSTGQGNAQNPTVVNKSKPGFLPPRQKSTMQKAVPGKTNNNTQGAVRSHKQPVTAPATKGVATTRVNPGKAEPAKRLDFVRSQRVQKKDGSGRSFLVEPGNRTLVRVNNKVVVHRDASVAIRLAHPGVRWTKQASGVRQGVYVRRDGFRVFTNVDSAGRVVHRYGIGPGGRRIVYVDNRRFYRNLAIGLGAAAVIGVGVVALAPPVFALPRAHYIVDYTNADDDLIYTTLTAPPVMRLERAYSLDEIRYSVSVRDRMRRVDLDSINFEFGSFEITPDQYPKLQRIARALSRAIAADQSEMFFVEGHTDAIGSPEDNASLSDRRAEAVVQVLTQQFGIPMENLESQGYGEQFLKLETDRASRVNRRVAIRRITPLLDRVEAQAQ